MNASSFSSKQQPCRCDTGKLFERLEVAQEGWERSALLLRLIEELNACMHIEDDLFYPWRPTTWSERMLRAEEALTQKQLARLGLYSVLVDSHMSFDTRLTLIRFLVGSHVRSAQGPRMVPQEEVGIRSSDLETIGMRVAALHHGAPPVTIDLEQTSVRRSRTDLEPRLGAPANTGSTTRAPTATVKRAA